MSIFITHFPFVLLHLPIKVQRQEDRVVFHHFPELLPLCYANAWRVCRRGCTSPMHAGVHVSASPDEGEVCNHLIQTYSRGISLLNLTVPFEPYLVSISHFSFGGRCRNWIPFVSKSLAIRRLLFVLSITIFYS